MQLISLVGALALIAAASKICALVYCGMLACRPTKLGWLVAALVLCDVMIFAESDLALARSVNPETIGHVKVLLRSCALTLVIAFSVSLTQIRFGGLAVSVYAVLGVWVASLGWVSTVELVTAPDTGLLAVNSAWLRRAYYGLGMVLFAALLLLGARSRLLVVRQRSRTVFAALIPLVVLFSAHFIAVGFSSAAMIDAAIKALLPLVISLVVIMVVLEESGLLPALRVKLEVLWRIVCHSGPIDASALTECLEHAMVRSALRRSEYNKAEAARLLGLSKSTFHRKATKYRSKKREAPAPDKPLAAL